MRFSSFLTGLLFGGLVGAAAALLLTPYSGEELKEEVTDWVENLKAEARLASEMKRAELEAQLEALKTLPPTTPSQDV